MANGFISSNERLDAEEVGDGVWNELYWRSFFQDIERDEFGKVTRFKMHDLVHDLAQSVVEDVCCVTDDIGVTALSGRIHHLSNYMQRSSLEANNSIQLHVKSLRTYIKGYIGGHYSPNVLKGYSLRVLDFIGRTTLSSSIGDLKHLRYLNLLGGDFKTLPKSLCKLWNLQILKLDYCDSLQKLPNSLISLKALQQLSLEGCHSLSSLPPQIGKLTSLRILSKYFVGKERGFLLAELGPLKLKGDLHIKHLEKVKSIMDARDANMSSKQLNELWLSWDRNEESESEENAEDILEVLQPDTQQLRILRVEGYKGVHFPQWMSSPSLNYLTYLGLQDCQSCLKLPHLGKLPSLKELWIYNMIQVEYLHEESYDGGVVFVALESLELRNLPNLIRLSREEGENMFPRLSKLKIQECPKFLGEVVSLQGLHSLTLTKLPNLIRLSREDGENMFPHLSKLDISECPELLGLPSLPSINNLSIQGKCKQDLLSSIHKLSSLVSVEIEENEELTCFPDGMLQNLTSLKELQFNRLPKLEVLQIKIFNLNAIQELFIMECGSLKLLLQGLHSLKSLHIEGCGKFNVSAGFQCPTCLEDLWIERCIEVEGLHEALQHMTALKKLMLCDLPNLESLPDCFGNLPLLHELGIGNCNKLRCLPTSLSLSSLQHLTIWGCPELQKRCQKKRGEDWPKIAHIPHIDMPPAEYKFCCGVLTRRA